MQSSFASKLRSCPHLAGLLLAITLASIATRLLLFGVKGNVDWALAPWYFDSHDGSGGVHDLSSTNLTVHHEEHDLELLFVGNSYTSVNDLAAITKQIIDSQWNTNVSVRAHHPGGQNFKGHLASTKADYVPPGGADYPSAHELREWLVTKPNQYNWVILQEQSQIPGFWGGVSPEWNDSFVSCQELDKLVRKIPNAQTMFYMTWGRRAGDTRNPNLYPDYLTHQWRLNQGYENYLEATSTPERPTFVAPVGLVFESIYMDIKGRKEDPLNENSLFYKLYREDGSHPSVAGSYLAALTMYASMLGDDPRDVEWIPEEVDAKMAKQIQNAVAWTILETTAMGMTYPWQAEIVDEELP